MLSIYILYIEKQRREIKKSRNEFFLSVVFVESFNSVLNRWTTELSRMLFWVSLHHDVIESIDISIILWYKLSFRQLKPYKIFCWKRLRNSCRAANVLKYLFLSYLKSFFAIRTYCVYCKCDKIIRQLNHFDTPSNKIAK